MSARVYKYIARIVQSFTYELKQKKIKYSLSIRIFLYPPKDAFYYNKKRQRNIEFFKKNQLFSSSSFKPIARYVIDWECSW